MKNINHITCIKLLLSLLASTVCYGRGETEQKTLPVQLQDVLQARELLQHPVVRHTPLVEEDTLSRISGARVFLKLENMQHTGSFKVRGSYNTIAHLTDEQRAKGVITASTGNHAQGVASAAKIFDIPALIVMPEDVPATKLAATKAHGATVLLYGKTFQEALNKALEIQEEKGLTFIHPYDDPLTIAGQGTIGLEIIEDLPDVDVVLIPVGGGGLASGIAVALKGLRPNVKVIGVEPEHAPSMKTALSRDQAIPIDLLPTLAEGAAVSQVGTIPHIILRNLMDELILVSEENIADAMLLLLLNDKILTEGAGALAAAGLLSGKLDHLKGQKVVLIISGGNIDSTELIKLLQRP